jgi:hypothetical protein
MRAWAVAAATLAAIGAVACGVVVVVYASVAVVVAVLKLMAMFA